MYVISVAAELAGMHPQTLRIYERKGLVEPARTGGGSRRYTDADIGRLHRIQELTNEGLNLVGVQRVLELEDEVARLAPSSQPRRSWLCASSRRRYTAENWYPSANRSRSTGGSTAARCS